MLGELQTKAEPTSKGEADKTPPTSKTRSRWPAYRRQIFRTLLHTTDGETSIRRKETFRLHEERWVKRKVRRATAEARLCSIQSARDRYRSQWR